MGQLSPPWPTPRGMVASIPGGHRAASSTTWGIHCSCPTINSQMERPRTNQWSGIPTFTWLDAAVFSWTRITMPFFAEDPLSPYNEVMCYGVLGALGWLINILLWFLLDFNAEHCLYSSQTWHGEDTTPTHPDSASKQLPEKGLSDLLSAPKSHSDVQTLGVAHSNFRLGTQKQCEPAYQFTFLCQCISFIHTCAILIYNCLIIFVCWRRLKKRLLGGGVKSLIPA